MQPETDFPTDLRALERDYELIRELGQGGMAAVYLARRRDTGRLVAIKAVRSRYLDDDDALRRFTREARTVADLDHPNIVRTEAIEQIGDRAVAIIMEYVPGGTVRDRLREYGAFSAEDAESVLRDVANALGYAHRRGIVHRDVKPENVFLDQRTGRALLSDFGIARRIEGDVPITLLGAALGTPQYMSPEQIDGSQIDGRSDIYSLGVLGWELLTGRRPWAGENLYSIIYKQKHETLPRITALRPRVPANLLFAIEGALVKDRARRWQSIDEFLQQLTYNPPPVLAQDFPASAADAMSPDADATVEFRPPRTPAPAAVPEMPRVPPAVASPARVVESVDAARATESSTRETRRTTGLREVRPMRRWLVRGLALLVPLAIAGISLYVVLGTRASDAPRPAPSGPLTTSAGTVVRPDSIPASDSIVHASPRTSPSPSRPGTSGGTDRPLPPERTPPSVAAPSAKDTERRVRAARPETATVVQVRRPTASRDSTPVSGPSPRCRVASMADQRACLLAYIAVNDSPLQGVYDSLIVELRRLARAPRGTPDPPSVTRLRVEQRAWISVRDRECTRNPTPGSTPYWAQPLSQCFADMSAARAGELREALQRTRRQ